MATTIRKYNKALKMNHFISRNIVLSLLALLFTPELFGVALFVATFLAYYTAIFCLLRVLLATYHLCKVVCSKCKKFRGGEEVELQSNGPTEALAHIEKMLWKTKHIALTNLIITFLGAKNKTAKFAALLGIWQLYADKTPSDFVKHTLMTHFDLINEAILKGWSMYQNVKNKRDIDDEVVEQSNDEEEKEIPQWARDFQHIFPQNEEIASCLERNRSWWALGAAAVAVATCLVPAGVVWALGDQKSFASSVIELGRTITAKNIIWTEVAKTKDKILWAIWKMAGQEYIPDADKAAQQVQNECVKLVKDLREFEILVNADFFGAVRSNKLAKVEDGIRRVDEMYKNLSSVQKSQYNLNQLLATIKSGYEDLVTKKIDMITNATGKQEPVVVQLVGPAGHGKSEFMKSIIRKLEDKYQIGTYYRNVHDEYWSHFCGQQILVWDDIGFAKDGADYAEFCYHTAGAPSSTVGAAIKDKGRPTNPLFIFITSNTCYLGNQGHQLTTPDAFHRRRDFLIDFRNTKAEDFMFKHGTTIPQTEYDPTKTKLMLMRPVPKKEGQDHLSNQLGIVKENTLIEAIIELEKQKSNRFKEQLRVKPYYQGIIPENAEVDHWLYSTDCLIGKTRVIEELKFDDVTEENSQDMVERLMNTVEEQAVNPEVVVSHRKTPVILISGPSGTGKTHTARTFAQQSGTEYVLADPFNFLPAKDKIYLIDDVTLSKERYMKAVEIANMQYEQGVCRSLIFTENSRKIKMMDDQCVAELHRRAHIVQFDYNWTWKQVLWSWGDLALKHKEELQAQTEKQFVMRKNVSAKFTEYSGSTEVIKPTEAAGVLHKFASKLYGDDVVRQEVWTLPMPRDIDFSVSLFKTFQEAGEMSFAEVFGSIFTGKLYSITNISGRFTIATSMQMVRDIFYQAPSFGVQDLDQMVINFNAAEVVSTFKPPGCCVLSTPEGALGLSWKGTHVRMFKITTDAVKLAEDKIDLHEYFNPDVDSLYKDLISTLVFSEDYVKDTVERIEEMQKKKFTATNIFCVILECVLYLLSISMQIYAPLALGSEFFGALEDRSRLKYLEAVQNTANSYYKSNKVVNQEPKIKIGTLEITIDSFERSLRVGAFKSEEIVTILASNPQLIAYLNHSILDRKTYPLTIAVTENFRRIPTAPYVFEEGITLDSRKTYTTTYELGEGFKKQGFTGVMREAFKNKWEYDEWIQRTFGNYRNVDRCDMNNEYSYDRYPEPNRGGTFDDWAAEESSPLKRVKNDKKLKVESSPVPKEKNQKKLKVESAPVPQIKNARKIKVLEEGTIFAWYDNKTCAISDVPAEMEGEVSKYVFMTKDGWISCNGPNPAIANTMRQKCVADNIEWAVMFTVATEDIPELAVEESASQYKEGTILRARRSLGPYEYWHMGVVAKHPISGELSLYHVQSNDIAGVLTSFIAVDVLPTEGWEIYRPNELYRDGDEYKVLKPLDNFDHIVEHAYRPFAYQVNASNCETWALAMVYGTQFHNIEVQKLPATFGPLMEIVGTFSNIRDRFAEYRELEQEVRTEACVDPTALSVARIGLASSYVFLHDLTTGTPIVKALGLKDRYIITVGHVAQNYVKATRYINHEKKEYAAKRVFVNTPNDISIYEIEDKTMPSFKDITRYFMTIKEIKETLSVGIDNLAVLNIPIDLGGKGISVTAHTCRVKGQIEEHYDPERRVGQHGLEYTTTLAGVLGEGAMTSKGDCGSPLIVFSPRSSRKLVGLHRAGSTANMYASITPQEWIIKALQTLQPEEESFSTKDGLVDMQSYDLIDEETGFPQVAQSIYVAGRCRGTKLRRTFLDPKTFQSDCEPAILSREDPRAKDYEPALTTLRKFKKETLVLDQQEIDNTADEVADYLATKLHGKVLRVFTQREAINGPSKHDYPFSGQIDRKTSAGFPQTQRDKVNSKAAYFDQVDQDGETMWKINDSEIGKRLQDDISRMITVASNGKRPNVVFSYFPKDEVLKRSKIYPTPNTRGILAGNLPYVIAYRRFFLSLHLRCQEIFSKIPIKIGINPRSLDWTDLKQYHLRVGSHGFDADAKNWDASIPIELMKACPRIINKIYQQLDPNWNEEDDVIRSALHSCVEAPYILYGRKVIQTVGGQVSGQPGTAFDNSLINWLLCAIIYKRVMKKAGKHELATFEAFMNNTAPSFYGDDMMITLSGEVVNDFNLDKYIVEAATFGIEITPADKTDKENRQLALSEMTFLKRGFKDIGKFCVGPIEEKSISKALKWLRGAGCYFPKIDNGEIVWKNSFDHGVLIENVRMQLGEAALHSKEKFDDLKREVNVVLAAQGMELVYRTYNGALAEAGVIIE